MLHGTGRQQRNRHNRDVIRRDRGDLQPIWPHWLLSESPEGMLILRINKSGLPGRLEDILNRHARCLGLRGGTDFKRDDFHFSSITY